MDKSNPAKRVLEKTFSAGWPIDTAWLSHLVARLGANGFIELVRVLALHAPDQITVQDTDLRYLVLVNPKRELSREAITGCSDHDLFEHQEADRLIELKKNVLENRRGQFVETMWVANEGDRIYLEGQIVPWVSQAGKIKGVIGYFHDVTRRRIAEKKLLQALDDLNESQRIARIGSYRFDLRSDTWTCTSTMDEIFGIPSGFSKQGVSSWEELLHPDDKSEVLQIFAPDVSGHGFIFDKEYRAVRRNDGTEIWVHGIGKLEKDGEGNTVSMFGTVQDITERKKTLERLRISEERFRLAQKATRDAIWDWDATNHSKIWSEAGLAPFGWGDPGVKPCTFDWWADRIHPEDRVRVLEHFSEAAADPQIEGWRDDYRFRRRNGTYADVVDRAIALRDSSGMAVRVVGAMRDVTDTKKTQDALRRANTRLRESDRLKDKFLAMLSHELRNPLAPIHNSLEILRRTSGRGELAERALAVLDRQVHHLTQMVNDLLDVTRIVRGKVMLRREPLDLCDHIRDAVSDHRSTFVAKGVDLELSMEGGPLWIQGDRTRLAEIIGNLLSNAAKFTPRGGKTRVRLESVQGKPQAILRISDTGQGISPQLLPHLFEPFIQADPSLDRSAGGLGLGLSVVKGLVELHGGSIQVDSHGKNLGTTFTLTFPLDEEARPTTDTPRDTEPPSPQRVLIIEDNVDAASALKDMLSLLGVQTEIAFTGPTGLEKARAMVPALILCDIGLPGMDGYELAARIRSCAELNQTRLVAMSGYANEEDIARAKESGFDAHLAKPARLTDVEHELRIGSNFQDGKSPG